MAEQEVEKSGREAEPAPATMRSTTVASYGVWMSWPPSRAVWWTSLFHEIQCGGAIFIVSEYGSLDHAWVDTVRRFRMRKHLLPGLVVAILLLPCVSEAAGDAERGAPVLIVETGESGTVLRLAGEEPFHRTANDVSGQRLVKVPGTDTVAALWNETGPDGRIVPFYSVGRNGWRSTATRSAVSAERSTASSPTTPISSG